jgi:hypothetical protein
MNLSRPTAIANLLKSEKGFPKVKPFAAAKIDARNSISVI